MDPPPTRPRHLPLRPHLPVSSNSSPTRTVSVCSLRITRTLLNTFRRGFAAFMDYPWHLLNPRGVLVWAWVTLTLLATPAETKYSEGYIKTTERWLFLERFCFLSKDGTFEFEVDYDLKYGTQRFLLYFDSPTQWPSVYRTEKTCEEKESVLISGNNQKINLTLPFNNRECEVVRHPGDTAYNHCKGFRSFDSLRERWWFVAVSNCESTQGMEMRYKLVMTNGDSYWYKHFSADEFYILRTNMSALAIQLGILLLALLASAELKKRELLHTTYRLYLATVSTQVFALSFLTLHYAKYGVNGIGFPFSKFIGRALHTASTVLMVLLLLLAAKGFNVTRGRLRQNSAVRLTAFMCMYIVTCLCLFIYEQQVFDPGEVLYLYESPAGYALVGLRLLAWLMFLYSCFFTVKHYPEKSGFYGPFFSFFSLWFLAGPMVIIICNHVIDKWVREKVVNGVDLSITLLGHLFFLVLTRPSAANKNFPFHVRTSQVRALEHSSTGVVGNNTLDAFSTHRYAPDLTEPHTHAAPDLFLVSGAVEMIPLPLPRGVTKNDQQSYHHHQDTKESAGPPPPSPPPPPQSAPSPPPPYDTPQ
ncbi:transmembrane protein 145-like [Portunus trituberculatus]|uniref:transmembrane protein 145-like n=1 Tax=Portunus trituberculatus TaxID=210409 RepID=UPI001E1CF063|nr:transmembrane protein 145-like [Portunus trituberculatus]XP_045106342.1 transmembrane protein 145-like [Portunus trituberculatus]